MMYLSDKRDTECLLLLLFLCLLVEGVFAQQNQDVYLVDSFEIEAQSISRPVAYVFTDKDIYETGEAIWFNFFQVDGQYLTPFLSDRVLYLRLVHQVSREVVWEERYGLSGGKGTGHLVIKDGIIPGMYQLEAYTPSGVDKGMSQFYSFKELEIRQFIVPSMEVRCHLPATLDSRDLVRVTVLERFERLAGAELSLSFLDSTKKVVYGEQLITCTKGEVSVEFPSGPIAYLDILVKNENKSVYERVEIPVSSKGVYPLFLTESSGLVSGHESWVSIRSLPESGEGFRSGKLLADGELLQFISVNDEGIGRFKFIPRNGSLYQVVWDGFPLDTVRVFESIVESGVTISLEAAEADTLVFYLQTSQVQQRHILRLQSRGIVYAYLDVILPARGIVKIPTIGLPTGILEVSVFDEEGGLLGDRLLWNEGSGRLIVRASIDKVNYDKRDKVKVRLSVEDVFGEPVKGAYVFGAVFDNLYSLEGVSRSFFSQVHGVSQVTSSARNSLNLEPFSATGVSSNQPRLWIGSEDYRWSEVNVRASKSVGPVLGNVQRGTVRYAKKKGEGNVSYALLFRGDEESGSNVISLDDTGNFEILPEDLAFASGEYLYIKSLPNGKRPVEMRIDNPFAGIDTVVGDVEFVQAFQHKKSKKGMVSRPAFDRSEILLNEFVVTARSLQSDDREKFIKSLHDRANKDFNTDFVCEVGGVLNCAICKYTNIRPVEGKIYTVVNDGDVARYVASKTANNHGTLRDFYRVTYTYPTYTEEELMRLYHIVRTKGFYKEGDFEHMTYPDEASKKRLESDYRSTLIWESGVYTDQNGQVELEFYTSDIRSIFMGRFEVQDLLGRFGSVAFEFIVDE